MNSSIDGELPLSYATRLGEDEIATLLLEQSPDQIRPGDDSTLLFWVVRNLSIEVLRRLLEQGLDPNAYSETLQQGHPSIRRQSRGASHGPWSRSTAFQRGRQHVTLVNATRSMKCMLIAKLLERGFDANEKSDTGETPLSLAVAAGYLEVAELLLRHGAEPNMRIGSFPSLLLLAIAKGYVEVVDVLRKYGAKEM
ncbi:hypothetical protein IFM61606_06671 [Aspergillus udagawae]|uniref:Uncharacterized protein n=1 Tax=Aspergillus udagawae TaxID=91492 RepID=A0ABQ1AUY0_9EURO|nr:hypothetical protein IFM53868_05533 [Aspergillus udagawae]GFG26677.1 hypothetical protein IFM61606_06671 [Aspergillus udagawae]